MGLSDLFASNILLKWLRGDTGRHDLTVTMAGVKIGERLLLVGAGDGTLLGALGEKVGLSGRAAVVDEDAVAVNAAGRAAEKAGVLVEAIQVNWPHLAHDTEAFDIVVFADAARLTSPTAAEILSEVKRVLRTGGRCLVLAPLPEKRGELGADEVEREPSLVAIRATLTSHGFRGARVLAARGGLAYLEAAKPR